MHTVKSFELKVYQMLTNEHSALHIIVANAFVDGDSPRLIAGFSSVPVMFLVGSLLAAD